MKGFRNKGIQIWRDSEIKGFKYEGIQKWRDSEIKGFRMKGFRTDEIILKGFKYEGIQIRRDSDPKGFKYLRIKKWRDTFEGILIGGLLFEGISSFSQFLFPLKQIFQNLILPTSEILKKYLLWPWWYHQKSISKRCRSLLSDGYLSRKALYNTTGSQCLKIPEKVAFIIASEASYLYILSGQKFIKNAKNGQSLKTQNSNATFFMIFKHCAG